ncbi:MAG: hypothetical protein Ta2G_03330 [Termitinemataceae bacterium]|nr:MAG: hypothetical protein Ta2G_03330 [Termitinemataceae bacterium]
MEYKTFLEFRKLCAYFKSIVKNIDCDLPALKNDIQKLVDEKGSPAYTVNRAVVYNDALSNVTQDNDIRLILLGDNPGRREQESGLYLVGPSGKIAEGFFKRENTLGIDFRKNVIILNKCPIHTPRTKDLEKLRLTPCIRGGTIWSCVENSEKLMVDLLIKFQSLLKVPVWITGYSEMRKNGIFDSYTNALRDAIAHDSEIKKNIFIYRHFSMNQFTIDLNKQRTEGETVKSALKRIGTAYRDRIL